MRINEGMTDRVFRVIIGSLALVAGFFWLAGTAQVVAYVIGAIALITGIVGYCGIYALIGVTTCPTKK